VQTRGCGTPALFSTTHVARPASHKYPARLERPSASLNNRLLISGIGRRHARPPAHHCAARSCCSRCQSSAIDRGTINQALGHEQRFQRFNAQRRMEGTALMIRAVVWWRSGPGSVIMIVVLVVNQGRAVWVAGIVLFACLRAARRSYARIAALLRCARGVSLRPCRAPPLRAPPPDIRWLLRLGFSCRQTFSASDAWLCW